MRCRASPHHINYRFGSLRLRALILDVVIVKLYSICVMTAHISCLEKVKERDGKCRKDVIVSQ